MNDKKGPLDWLKEKLLPDKESNAGNKKNNKTQYFLILLVFGIAFMLISDFWKSSHKTESSAVTNQVSEEDVATFGSKSKDESGSMKAYEEQYENELRDVLEQIAGVGKVSVIVTVEATESKVYEKNTVRQNQTTTETDNKGGERKVDDISEDEKLVIIRDGDKEVPLVTETRKPKISGVLVVAEGAKNISIKSNIIESVTRVLDVPSHKVSVQAKKN